MENKTPSFLPQVITTDDRDNLVAKIRLVAQNAFKSTGTSLEAITSKELPANILQGFQEWMSQAGDTNDKQEFANRCENLISVLESLPMVSITLAYPPTISQTEKIVNLARAKFSPTAILEIKVDPAILGGAIVSYGGKYYDQSLARLIDQNIDKYNLTIQNTYV